MPNKNQTLVNSLWLPFLLSKSDPTTKVFISRIFRHSKVSIILLALTYRNKGFWLKTSSLSIMEIRRTFSFLLSSPWTTYIIVRAAALTFYKNFQKRQPKDPIFRIKFCQINNHMSSTSRLILNRIIPLMGLLYNNSRKPLLMMMQSS